MRGTATRPGSRPKLPSRLAALPACLGFLALAALSLALALPGLLGFLHGVSHRTPLVVLKPREAVGPTLALGFIGLAGLTLSEPLVPGRRSRTPRRMSHRRVTWPGACLALAMGSVLLTVIAVPAAEIAATLVMSNHGYRRCPDRDAHPPMRWVLPGGRCP